jgi:hypothetical protein
MSKMGLEPTIPDFERAKIVYALYLAATVFGLHLPTSTVFLE